MTEKIKIRLGTTPKFNDLKKFELYELFFVFL